MIVGIVGSPRKGQFTDQLVTKTLDEAREIELKTKKVYLVDFDIKFHMDGRECCPEKLSELCEEADGIVLGAPVYYGDINGLTKDFMDTVSIPNANGKYTIGFAIAGGSGKGLCSGIQSIYHFFYHRQLRGIDPTPISRFNFEEALKTLQESGRKIAKVSREKKPFYNLWDRIEYYEKLNFMNYTFLDEILLLAYQLIQISKGEESKREDLLKARLEYKTAKNLVEQGKRIEAAQHAVKAYDILYF